MDIEVTKNKPIPVLLEVFYKGGDKQRYQTYAQCLYDVYARSGYIYDKSILPIKDIDIHLNLEDPKALPLRLDHEVYKYFCK